MKKTANNIKVFTYGHQFEVKKAPLSKYLDLIVKCEPSRKDLESELRLHFFSNHSSGTNPSSIDDNQKKLAMNLFLSLRAYQLLEDVPDNKLKYKSTDLLKHLQACPDEDSRHKEFARHILINLSGTDYLKAIESVMQRGEDPTLSTVILQLNEMGYELATNSIYPSTMKQWLKKAGLFEGDDKIAWDIFHEITGIDRELMDALYKLNPFQKYFLLSLLEMNPSESIAWPEVVQHTATTKRLNYDMKLFPKTVLEPLIEAGFIKMDKTTTGRGAKPNKVRLTKLGNSNFLEPFVNNLSCLVGIDSAELNRPFEEILIEVDDPDKHVKGRALELLAIWIIRMCGLRFIDWRKRDAETGKGEVDVMAASDTFVYNRWQIQCKNTKSVDIDIVAKEVGMIFLTRADIVMIITTGVFTSAATNYADSICNRSRYYVILIDGNHLKLIRENKTNLVPILNKIAKRTFVRKEYFMTNNDASLIVENLEVDDADARLSLDLGEAPE